MAPQKITRAAMRKAQATPVNAQERLRTWIFGNYFEEDLMSTKVRRTAVLTRADFDQLYIEPALERWALERPLVPAPEPEATLDSQRARSVLTGGATRASSNAADSITSSSGPHFSRGMRFSRQPRSLHELLCKQPGFDEVGSGYGADVSDNADSSETSSRIGSDSSSSNQYTPDASSSDSDSEDSSDSDHEGSSDSNHAGSSDSNHGSVADPDSEVQSISSRVNAVTSSKSHERLNAPQERQESSNSANESSATLSLPANSRIAIVTQRLAELDRAIDRARHFLQTTAGYSRGEYLASVASLEALEHEREREQLRFGAFCWQYQ